MGQTINEQRFKKRFQEQVLSYLLDKYERSKSFKSDEPVAQRPQFALKDSPFWRDYHDEMDYFKREWMNEVLIALEKQGIVSLKWERFRDGELLAKVYLEWSGLADAYRIVGREPKIVKLERLRHIFRPLADHPWSWVQRFWQETDDRLSQRKTAGLELDDVSGYADLVKVLQALPDLEELGILKRRFSQELFRDSKHFERHVQRRLVSLLREYGALELDTEEEYLDSVGIVETPHIIRISGPLMFQVGERLLETDGFVGGVGLSADTIREMEVVRVKASRFITIENLTSYHQWLQERASRSELVVYTGGFPNRTLQRLLQKLADYLEQQAPELPVVHWGDIDLGGIRIFQFLKTRFFPGLQPILMDVNTLETHRERGLMIDDKYAKKAQAMMADPCLAEWHDVIEWILRNRMRLEQESISSIPTGV